MTSAQALRDIRGYAAAGRVTIRVHARRRMKERNATEADVIHALVNARSCVAEPEERWCVSSADLEGEALTLIVVIEDGDVVVTLY
jgi:hypothetical protein